MRLVDADALIAEYDRVHIGEPGKARKLIEDAPTIEPERTGKWIPVIERFPGKHGEMYLVTISEGVELLEDERYCRNCGARMKERINKCYL